MGTPKNLKEAILNGFTDFSNDHNAHLKHMERHIKDYLAQNINVALLSAENKEIEDAIIKLAESMGVVVRK